LTAKLSIAREIAFDAFVGVMHENKPLEETLETLVAKYSNRLKRLDHNFIKELVWGSLRWYSKIFWILQNTSKRDLKESPPQVQTALVMGTYQIFYMDRVPDRAAVNESAEYVRTKGHANAVPFVNGILRQIARKAEYFAKPDKDEQPVEFLALQYAHPKWMVERWLRRFRFEKTQQITSSNNKPPPYNGRINFLKVPMDSAVSLQEQVLKAERTHTERRPLRSSIRFKTSPNLEEGSLFSQGLYSIQDESSQLIGLIAKPSEGQVVVDACSGPGGKLGHMYELSHGQAKFIAIEKDEGQLNKAKSNMERLGHTGVEWIFNDFLNYSPKQAPDLILLDAPCSGLGVLRRHPEGKWLKKPSIIGEMAKKQRLLIHHALSILKPGGELVYSVCSFEEEESLDHLKHLQKEGEFNFEIVSPLPRLPDYYKKYVTRENILMVFSGNQDDADGFAAFVLKKK
jgi:16S rRNA (cytosine967-C5)-methyltransferase